MELTIASETFAKYLDMADGDESLAKQIIAAVLEKAPELDPLIEHVFEDLGIE